MLKARHEVLYSHTLICHSIFILSLGYTEKRSKEWKQGIVRAIGITSESLRFYWMRDVIKRTSDLYNFETEIPSTEAIEITNKWDRVSRCVRSGNPFNLGKHTYPHDALCTIVSLLNCNEDSENSFNESKKDTENTDNCSLVPHRGICPRGAIAGIPCSIGSRIGDTFKLGTNEYSNEILSSLVVHRGICFKGAIPDSLVPQHSFCPRRANAGIPCSIGSRSCDPFKLGTNGYSHEILSTLFSPVTYNNGTEMEISSKESEKGKVDHCSLVVHRGICPKGAISDSLVPQHSFCPRRTNAVVHYTPPLFPANRCFKPHSLVPQHSFCPRRANAVVHSTPPPLFPANRCFKPLYRICLISASRMMMLFVKRHC